MTNLEKKEPTQGIVVDRSGFIVLLMGVKRKEVPHADLIQTAMNISAIVVFGLGVNFSTEGGVEGLYKNYWVELRNGYDNLGVTSEDYPYPSKKGLNEILKFYEQFLTQMFIKNNGKLLKDAPFQTTEAVWTKLKEVMGELGRKKGINDLPTQVILRLTNDNLGRIYLRGLTDEEIVQHFVPPPLD